MSRLPADGRDRTIGTGYGLCGLVKNRIGGAVDAVGGLALETLWLTPIAIRQLVVVAMTTGITYGTAGAGHAVALSFAGVATTVPLLLFAAGSRRVALSTMGMLQFVTPILQFLTGGVPPRRGDAARAADRLRVGLGRVSAADRRRPAIGKARAPCPCGRPAPRLRRSGRTRLTRLIGVLRSSSSPRWRAQRWTCVTE